jgi:hypothetical protein
MVQFGIISHVANPMVTPMLMRAGLLISKVAPQRRKHGRARVAVVGEPGFTRIEGTAVAWGTPDSILELLTGQNEDGLPWMPDPNVVLVIPESIPTDEPLAVAVAKMRETGRRVEVVVANDDGTLLVEFRADGGVLHGPRPSHRHTMAAAFIAPVVVVPDPVVADPVLADEPAEPTELAEDGEPESKAKRKVAKKS